MAGWGSGPWGSGPWGSEEDPPTPSAPTDGGILRVVSVTNTVIKVLFTTAMKNDDILGDISSFSINNNLRILSVKRPTSPSTSYVLIETDQPVAGTRYTITVENIKTASGGDIDSLFESADFVARETKLNAMYNNIPSVITRNKDSNIFNVLAAISIEDDLIGGNRDDDI